MQKEKACLKNPPSRLFLFLLLISALIPYAELFQPIGISLQSIVWAQTPFPIESDSTWYVHAGTLIQMKDILHGNAMRAFDA